MAPKIQKWVFLFSALAIGVPQTALPRDPTTNPDSMCSVLYKVLRTDPYTNGILSENLKDSSIVPGMDPLYPSFEVGARKRVGAIASNPELRNLLVKASMADLRAQSRLIQESIDTAMSTTTIDEAAQAYDIVNIGAGIQEGIFQNGFEDSLMRMPVSKRPKVLTVESSDTVASTFEGGFWRLNSTTRESVRDVVPGPGRGNLNELKGGILQLPQVSSEVWTQASDLADVAQINRNAREAPVLFNNSFVSVTKRGANPGSEEWPAKYRLKLKGKDGKTRYIYANIILDGTGIGKEKFPFSDPESIKLAEEFQSKGSVMFFSDLRNQIAMSQTPFRDFVDEDILVVGGKDGGKTVNEFLLRQSPPKAYKRDVSQVGAVKSVEWVGVSDADCREYALNNRVRYSWLSGPLKNKTLIPNDGRLVGIKRDTNSGRVIPILERVVPIIKKKKKKANLDDILPAGSSDVSYGDVQDFEKIISIERSRDKELLEKSYGDYRLLPIKGGDGKRVKIQFRGQVIRYAGAPKDRIVFANGYENDADLPYRSLNRNAPIAEGDALFDSNNILAVKGSVPEVPGREVAYAYQLGPFGQRESIFFYGVRAKGLVNEEELGGVTDNVVSIYGNGPRAYKFGDYIARFVRPKGFAEPIPASRVNIELAPEKVSIPPKDATLNSTKEITGTSKQEITPFTQPYLVTRVAHAMDQFNLPNNETISFSIANLGRGRIQVIFNTNLTEQSQRAVIQKFKENPEFVDLINAATATVSNVRRELKVKIVTNARGRVKVGDTRVNIVDAE